jgi:hypothetical protein
MCRLPSRTGGRAIGVTERGSPLVLAAVLKSGPGTEGELRPSGSYGRNRRDFCRGSQAGRTRSDDPNQTSGTKRSQPTKVVACPRRSW